jgi:hypothetical protein
VADLDPTIGYGTVTGFFFAADGDSPDDGLQPDMAPLQGKITLSHNLTPPFVRTSQGLMAIRTVVAQVIDGIVYGPKGVVGDPDAAEGASLVATNQASINPSGWQWTATFSIDGLAVQPPAVTFSLAPGDSVDLSLAYNAPSTTPAVQVVVSHADAVAAATSAALAQGYATAAQAAGRNFVILNATDPVPAGTPDGSVVFRTNF